MAGVDPTLIYPSCIGSPEIALDIIAVARYIKHDHDMGVAQSAIAQFLPSLTWTRILL